MVEKKNVVDEKINRSAFEYCAKLWCLKFIFLARYYDIYKWSFTTSQYPVLALILSIYRITNCGTIVVHYNMFNISFNAYDTPVRSTKYTSSFDELIHTSSSVFINYNRTASLSASSSEFHFDIKHMGNNRQSL